MRRLSALAYRLSLATPLAGDPRFRPKRRLSPPSYPGSTISSTARPMSRSRASSSRLIGPRPRRRPSGRRKLIQPVIDSHFHIWRRADLPWLSGPMVPRIFGPYEPIRRDYAIDEYLADLNGLGVAKSVYVQTNWAKEDFEREVASVSETAKETGWPHAIVGYADMTVDDVRPQLDRLKAHPLVRGVRMQLHWHEVPEYRFAPGPDQLLDSAVRRNGRASRTTASPSTSSSSQRR